jgi:hypothetical protein
MINASIEFRTHLGDKIMSCIILHSISLKFNEEISVSCCEDTKRIIELLEFGNKIIPNNMAATPPDLPFKSFLPMLKHSEVKCLNIPFIHIESYCELDSLVIPKQKQCPKKEITYFQVDNRSYHSSKKGLNNRQKINFINKKSRFNPIGIGGSDTQMDMPFNYDLGNLDHIVNKMKSASQFVGVDSGMSHVAGVLGISSHIFITHRNRQDIRDIQLLYSMLYKDSICHSLRAIL